jgi:hypothetical protein
LRAAPGGVLLVGPLSQITIEAPPGSSRTSTLGFFIPAAAAPRKALVT